MFSFAAMVDWLAKALPEPIFAFISSKFIVTGKATDTFSIDFLWLLLTSCQIQYIEFIDLEQFFVIIGQCVAHVLIVFSLLNR